MNEKPIKRMIKDIRIRNWQPLQEVFTKLILQVPENAPSYQNIFHIFLMVFTLNHPNGPKTRYSNVTNLSEKMIDRIKRLKRG